MLSITRQSVGRKRERLGDRFESLFQLDLVDSIASGLKDHVMDHQLVLTLYNNMAILKSCDQLFV